MKVSIILPIYDVEKYLSRCLDSLIGQTLQDIEIICVNDASPDGCDKVLEAYAKKDKRIKVITQKVNGGAAVARQAGVDIATGEYLGFVDPDDYVNKDFFERLYNLAESEKADIAKGAVITVDTDGTEKVTSTLLNQQIRQSKFKFFGQNLWDAIYKTEMVRKHNIHFEIDIFCFGLQATFWANKIAVCDDAFYKYVRRQDSCDSDVFSVHKWLHWNVRGAKYYMTLLNSLDYTPQDYSNIAGYFIFSLYFYGYDRLLISDRRENTSKLADFLIEFGEILKYKDVIKPKLNIYGDAIFAKEKKRLVRLIKCRHVKNKFLKKILLKVYNKAG